MKTEKTAQVNVRLTAETIDKINLLVDGGEFDNLSSFVRFAIKHTLDEFNGRLPKD